MHCSYDGAAQVVLADLDLLAPSRDIVSQKIIPRRDVLLGIISWETISPQRRFLTKSQPLYGASTQ